VSKYKLFTVEHSYFSGKIKSYLNWKQYHGSLGDGYENILATPELITSLLVPKSGVPSLPQMEAPNDTWIQDSSSIFDYIEALHPEVPAVPSPSESPRQCLVSYLVELLADEWLIVSAGRQRWHYSKENINKSHLAFNEQQWGAWLAPEAKGLQRRQAGAKFFKTSFGISKTGNDMPPGIGELGLTSNTEAVWLESLENIMSLLEKHLDHHDYLLGGQPSLGDFALIGPFYAHFYRDAAPGFDLRTRFPLTAEWVERTYNHDNINARSYAQSLYSLEDGKLIGRPATSDSGAWLSDDAIPTTLEAIVAVFFNEMWPVLKDASQKLTDFILSDQHQIGDELPRKSFAASPGFEHLQTNGGTLTHEFELGGVKARRMVIANQMWMLQRMLPVIKACTSKETVREWMKIFQNAEEVLNLKEIIGGFKIEKRGGKLFSASDKS
tara:strand:+ start:784 stop:2100 length:1317 start_codon:yes stop_codon:yes gene_type:complete